MVKCSMLADEVTGMEIDEPLAAPSTENENSEAVPNGNAVNDRNARLAAAESAMEMDLAPELQNGRLRREAEHVGAMLCPLNGRNSFANSCSERQETGIL